MRHHPRQVALGACFLALMGTSVNGSAQVSAVPNAAPFGVSNPKNTKWSADEAVRIYFSACDRVARTIRPTDPPHLRPSFVLVLGAQKNETLRDGKVSELRLKEWDEAAFAQAVVVLAAREIISPEDVAHLTHDTLTFARASVSVGDLREER